MRNERRSEARAKSNLLARWDGLAGRYEARVTDISLGGCFVNTHVPVSEKQVVSLSIKLPAGQWLDLRGEVTSCQPGVGFGLLFSFLTDDEESVLREII